MIEVVYPSNIDVSNPVSCTNVVGLVGITCTIDDVARKITASGWSNEIASGSALKFTISSVTNPATAAPQNLQIRTYTDSSA